MVCLSSVHRPKLSGKINFLVELRAPSLDLFSVYFYSLSSIFPVSVSPSNYILLVVNGLLLSKKIRTHMK